MPRMTFSTTPASAAEQERTAIAATLAQVSDPRELAAIRRAVDRLIAGAGEELVERLFRRDMQRRVF